MSRSITPDYVHHVHGRIRIKFAELRGNSSELSEAERRLAAVPGVTEVRGNALTGSIILTYDSTTLLPEEISERLRECGLEVGSSRSPTTPVAHTSLGKMLFETSARSIVDALVQRAVLALIFR